jgi:hypothetical protein
VQVVVVAVLVVVEWAEFLGQVGILVVVAVK